MLGGGRFFCKQLHPLPKVIPTRLSVRYIKTAGAAQPNENPIPSSKGKVVIPPRVERGPTDILKALSATVGYDPTAFPYRLPDDPYFTCFSSYEVMMSNIALESGSKSAKWIIENNASLFQHKVSEPHIKAFCPKLPALEETDFTEKELICAIEERDVANAIKIYETLKNKNCDVSQATKQCLLELVCFYNCSPVPEENMDTKWWDLEITENDVPWKQNGFAEKLFEEMDPKCPLANSALILGKFKFGDTKSAQDLFEKARSANIKLSVEAYNSFIKEVFINSKADVPSYKKILADMAAEGIKPNLGTLTSILRSLLRPKYLPQRKVWGEEAFEHFVGLGIEPPIGAYSYLISICGKAARYDRFPLQVALDSIYRLMDELEKKDYEIRVFDDLIFFQYVIKTACDDLEDPELAKRIINFYFMKNNCQFIIKEKYQEYLFRTFCVVLFRKDTMESAMDMYRRYIYKKFCPDVNLLSVIFEEIEYKFTPQYLPGLWNDITNITSLYKNRVVLSKFLRLVNTFTDEESLNVFHKAALVSFQRIQEKEMMFEEENTFSDTLITFAKCKDKKRIHRLFEFITTECFINLRPDSLKATCEFAASVGDFRLILECLRLAAEKSKKLASEMAEQVAPSLSGTDKVLVEKFIIKKRGDKEV